MKKLLQGLAVSALALALGLSTASIANATYGTIPSGATAVKGTGSNFSPAGWSPVFDLAQGQPESQVAYWHFVDSGTNANKQPSAKSMELWFNGGANVFDWTPSMGFTTNGGGKNAGWVLRTPHTWTLSGGYLLPALNQFNLSGYVNLYTGPTTGSLTTHIDAMLQQNQDTYQPVWQRTYQPEWQLTYQPEWQRTYQPEWQLTYQPQWQRTYEPIWQQTYQPYYVSTYARPVSTGGNDTLVSRLTYTSDTSASAVPVNGGTFKNGHTYVAINVSDASLPGGVNVPIGDSSFNSNGKKTPSQYNNPIGYDYNVSIVNGKLTVSFNSDLISASVGAYVEGSLVTGKNGRVDADASFPGNAPKHYPDSVTLDVPANNGTVYLYVHIDGQTLKWYSGPYAFVGYQKQSDDLVSDTQVDSNLKADYFVRNDVASDAWVRDDLKSDVLDHNNLIADALVRNDLVSDELVRNDYVSSQTISTPLKDMTGFNLSVSNAQNAVICSGDVATCGSLTNLVPGHYSVTLTGNGIPAVTQQVSVVAGQDASAEFDGITVVGPDLAFTYLDKTYLDDIYLDKAYLEDAYLDKTYLPDIYLDITYLAPVYNDKTYLPDIILEKTYNTPIYLTPINLGDGPAGPVSGNPNDLYLN